MAFHAARAELGKHGAECEAVKAEGVYGPTLYRESMWTPDLH